MVKALICLEGVSAEAIGRLVLPHPRTGTGLGPAAADAPRVLWGAASVIASGETLVVRDLGPWDGAVISLAAND